MRLARSGNIGPVTFRKLLERFGTAVTAIEALPDIIAKTGGKRQIRLASRDEVVSEIEASLALGAKPVIQGDAAYPDALAAIEDAPPFFHCLGNADLLPRPAIGIVGARNASAGGQRFAAQLARELAEAGYVVVSGMARGIDGAAHQSIVDHFASSSGAPDAGGTIAVLAGGVDVIYPREHASLYKGICQGGAIISEMPPGLKPQARHFPRRNRIISGLSLGVIVIEAGRNSGSLITARMAADQGRDVFAVPGNPNDPRAAGPNSLIRDGAILCDSARTVLDILADRRTGQHFNEGHTRFNREATQTIGAQSGNGYDDILASLDYDSLLAGGTPYAGDEPTVPKTAPSGTSHTVEKTQAQLLDLLSAAPLAIDALIQVSNLPAAMVTSLLIELELAGRVERHPGNRVSRIAD